MINKHQEQDKGKKDMGKFNQCNQANATDAK